MRQIDFRRIFGGSIKPCSSAASPEPAQETQLELSETGTFRNRFGKRIRLSSQLINICFVLLACLGALACAVFFFKKGELFRTAAWPHELFYHRSPTETKRPEPVEGDKSKRSDPQQVEPNSESSSDRSGDPFARAGRFLNLQPPSLVGPERANGDALPSAAIRPSLEELLSRLNTPLAGDAKDLDPGAADRGQAESPATTTAENSRLRLRPPADLKTRGEAAGWSRNARKSRKVRAGRKLAHAAKKNRFRQRPKLAARPGGRLSLEARHRASLLSDAPSNSRPGGDRPGQATTVLKPVMNTGPLGETIRGNSDPISRPIDEFGAGHR